MDVFDAIRSRFSVRTYEKRPVEGETLAAVLEAGRIAPTAANLQPVHVFAACTPEAVAKVSRAANLHGAPCALVVCADRDSAWHRADGFVSAQVDASIATDEMMLAATALGLGTLWICAFNAEILRRELDLPSSVNPVNILALGYADAEEPDGRLDGRKETGSFVTFL